MGLLWGLGETLAVLSLGADEPAAVLLFYPVVALALALPLVASLARVPAELALPRLALRLVAVCAAVPLAVAVNINYVRHIPMVSATNIAIVLGSLGAGLAPGWLAGRATRRLLPALLAPRKGAAGTLARLLPAAALAACCWHTALVFRAPEPGPWPDNRAALGDKPNIVLIVLDTLRADHVSGFGYERDTTPHLDALPATRFTHAYAPGHWTLPSTASLLTGLYPATHGATLFGSVLPSDATTLTQMLSRAGFVTGYFTGNYAVSGAFGFGREADWLVSGARLPHYRLFPSSLGRVLMRKVGDVTRANHLNEWVLPFLRSVADRRFFLYLHYKDPHQPYTPPSPHFSHFDPGFDGRRILDPSLRGQWPISARERENMVARYDGEIRFLDAEIGRVLDEMERLGLRRNTLLIVTSDHGEEFADHGGWLHGKTVFEEIARVPLLVTYPPLDTAGVTVERPVRLIDIVPTVLDVLGMPTPADIQGLSLLPLLEGQGKGARRTVLVDGERTGHLAYLRGRYKLVRQSTASRPVYSLFDLEADPLEQRNIAAQHPDLVEQLREAMEQEERHYRSVGLDAERKELDPLEHEALRQLGYVR